VFTDVRAAFASFLFFAMLFALSSSHRLVLLASVSALCVCRGTKLRSQCWKFTTSKCEICWRKNILKEVFPLDRHQPRHSLCRVWNTFPLAVISRFQREWNKVTYTLHCVFVSWLLGHPVHVHYEIVDEVHTKSMKLLNSTRVRSGLMKFV